MNNNGDKKNNKKLMIIVIAFVVIICAVLIIHILNNKTPKEKIYLKTNEVSDIFKSTKDYENKYVKLAGMVYKIESFKKEKIIYAYTNIEDLDNIVAIKYSGKSSVKKNDYIIFNGYITGSEEKTNYPCIEAEKVKVVTYEDTAILTKKELVINKKQTQNDVDITINKIEFSNIETRVYITVKNKSKYEFSLSDTATLSQAGKQYGVISSKNKKEISPVILENEKSKGVIVFPRAYEGNLSITLRGNSSNNSIQFKDFVFDIEVK